ncbi:unnamed protein product, partial [Brassica rapa subsp. trilocularis]
FRRCISGEALGLCVSGLALSLCIFGEALCRSPVKLFTAASPVKLMQRWSNQKLTWKRKDLLSKCNLVDATLWMQNLSMETRGCNYVDVEPVNKPE